MDINCRPEDPALKGPSRKCGTCASVRASDHSRLATMGALPQSVSIRTARVSSVEIFSRLRCPIFAAIFRIAAMPSEYIAFRRTKL
jgi:hypothetical protein